MSGATCTQTTDIVEIGNANPDFNMSFNTNFKWNQLTINGLIDWSQGGNLYNGTRQWAFQATRDRVQDQSGKGQNDPSCPVMSSDPAVVGVGLANPTVGLCPRKSAGYYGVGFYNGLSANDFFVEDGSYAKLKEFSVHYNIMNDQLRRVGLGRIPSARVGLIGRNLLTFTDYSGLDPEVSGLFGDPFQVRMDWFQYPQFRTFSAVVEFTF
jgi:hypothetical protein